MADTLPKIAPLAPGAGSVVDSPEALQYQEAMNQSMQALEQRMQPRTNLFNIAAGFLKPTRGGSFGESLGNVNEAMGAEQTRQSQETVPIAQMRAQLAGQKYQMSLENKSQQALAQAVGGMDQQAISEALSSPQGAIGNPQLMQRLSQAQMLAQPGTKAYEQIKTMLETQKNMIDLGIKSGQLSNDQARLFFTTGYGKPPTTAPVTSRPAGQPGVEGISSNPLLQIFAGGESGLRNVPNAAGASSAFGPYQITQGTFDAVKKDIPELKDKTFDDFKKDVGGIQTPVAETLLAKNQDLLKSAKLPLSPLNQYSVWFSGDTKLASADPKTPIDQVMSKEAIVANKLEGKTVGDVMGQLRGNLSRGLESASYTPAVGTEAPMTPEAQQQLRMKREEADIQVSREAATERGKPYAEKHAALAAYDYNTVKLNDSKSRELMQLVKDNPDVVGQLVHQGPVYAILQAAESGVSTPWGSLSVPVSDSLNKLNLTPDKQAVARNISQLISDLNQSVMKAGKGIYGPQISVFDAQQMAKPGFKETDPSSFLMYLAGKNVVTNKYMGDMAQAQMQYFETHPRASTSSFFNSKEYKSIADQFHTTYDDLVKQSPYGGK